MKRILGLQILMLSLLSSNCADLKSPEGAINEFLTHETKESFLTLPLCKAGEKVVPLLTEKIKDKNMKRRRYAIGFLGITESRLPVPVLEQIAKDETEDALYRGDALEALYLLDENLGEMLAGNYQNRTDFLGRIAKEILQIKNHAVYKKEQQELICNPKD